MKFIFSLLLVLVLAAGAQAQDGMTFVTWDISFPVSDMGDFIGETSFRGFGLDGRKFLQPNLSVGLSFDWNTFREFTGGTIFFENGSVSGSQNRVIYASPILVNAHYYFQTIDNNPGFLTYVGGGLGTYFIERTLEIGVAGITDNHLHFGLAGEVGLIIPVRPGTGGLISAKYNHAFGVDGSIDYSYWRLNAGVAYYF